MSSTPRRELQLQGPRPSPLKISNSSSKIKKAKLNAKSPVVIYVKSPEIIHVRPEEFMGLVQRLTGKDAPSCDIEVDESTSRRDLCGEEEETLEVDYGDQGLIWKWNVSYLASVPNFLCIEEDLPGIDGLIS